jgi:hypothetical protein
MSLRFLLLAVAFIGSPGLFFFLGYMVRTHM